MASIAAAAPRRTGLALRYRARRLLRFAQVPQYLWFHKAKFGIANTKFDITYCVFRESFLGDQYGIRAFLDQLKSSDEIFFLDIGRNHGLVFYYMMYHIMKTGFAVKRINYVGIDPSPLKFVYFDFHDWLKAKGIEIHYRIIDRAVVFDDAPTVTLSYGEDNFGNFHVAGSNYAENSKPRQHQFECIDIEVDTMRFDAVKAMVAAHAATGTAIVKIDCKNRTDQMFAEMLDLVPDHARNYLVAAERDGSSDRDLSAYDVPGERVLRTSRIA